MGMLFSCLIVGYDPLSYGSESLFSITDNVRSTLQSISFDDSETSLQGTEQIEGLVSLDGSEMDPPLAPDKSIKSDEPKTLRSCHLRKRSLDSILIRPDSPKHDEAAVKLQKVYKSFRTRRQLADCAVVVEQRWWKLLDFALLKRSSVSFFDIEKQESAVSRWSRAKSRAAKVGKGLSKDDKAQKLALQHWLEAIDPRHRYGHNLQFYYDRWLQCESKQPFFYWLDVGEGKEVNLQEQCSRSKLQEECIKYLGPKEREAYEVTIEDGKFMYRQSMQLLDTSHGQRDAKWIFVLSTSRKLYVGQKHKGKFQHSSFLAGGATSAAGRLVVENGALKAVWHHSGHYRPTEENFHEFMGFLKENNVNLTDVKKTSTEEDGEVSSGLTKSRSELNLAERSDASHSSSIEQMRIRCADPKVELKDKLICMQPNHNADNQHEDSDEEDNINVREPTRTSSAEEDEQASATSSDADTETIFQEKKLFVQDQGDDEETIVPSELILRRINSKKGIQSYQLGKQLSCKWTTGAGPRIGCVRDYPSELQFRALEQVNLSPRSLKTSRLSLPQIAKCQSPTAHESSAEELPQPASS